jgi:hypothetical protein
MSYESTNQLLTEFLGKDVFKYVVNEYLMISKEEVRDNYDWVMRHLRMISKYNLDSHGEILDVFEDVREELGEEIDRLRYLDDVFEPSFMQPKIDDLNAQINELIIFENKYKDEIEKPMPDDLKLIQEAKSMAREYLRNYNYVGY